ncbi:hypothetical protein PRUPE_3G122500 [Prunus persica]|uniref:Uncharacterized protein n=1 Tax=Prunus persica TaxID=3760 RepID=M5X461_PRUPE|nr:hypothetical protein PRUPE_3G122500 [Prunus persica]
MELPTKTVDCDAEKTRYRIKTRKVSYKLSTRVEFHWMVWPEEPPKASYILKNVSCYARLGEITAIAGPSGARKTTLLEILAGMIPLNIIVGQVLVNEQPMNKATSRVEKLLDELGVEHIANVRVGSKSNCWISGDEKHRVSIGVYLVHDPAILLLDEPTSGLDSASALDVALLLKSMAAQQREYNCLFNQILLLSNGTLLHHGSLHLLEQRLKYVGHFIPNNLLEFAMDATKDLIGVEEIKEEYEYIRAGQCSTKYLAACLAFVQSSMTKSTEATVKIKRNSYK